ncbi:hypothetical protein [Marinobacter shengliensis]|jgi:hypothetical protein|uniref:hypothetical protein n=1 Tax=Marinobacter shengliensis TaxID=1389223 RepID=UPI0035B71489
MPRMTQKPTQQLVMSALLAFPGINLAGETVPIDYLGANQLVLEIRYCECEAIKPDGDSSDLLPGFLKESKALKVAVSAGEHGFVASDEVSIGYKFDLVTGSSEEFEFSYAGTYATGSGSSSGQGRFVLEKGQWANIFGLRHRTETELLHTNVAVRLVELGGS